MELVVTIGCVLAHEGTLSFMCCCELYTCARAFRAMP
jgi:hypothetical protein